MSSTLSLSLPPSLPNGISCLFPTEDGGGLHSFRGEGVGWDGGTDPSGKWAGGANELTLEAESDGAKV